jgi:hypothetical protein
VTEQEWLTWYRQSRDAVAKKALDAFLSSGDDRLVPLFWQALPAEYGHFLPASIEWVWVMWYGSLPRVQRLAINAYLYTGDTRLVLFLWDSLLDKVQQPTKVAMP